MGERRSVVVATRKPAVDGRANEAVVALLAVALGVRRTQLRIANGARGRDKMVEIVEPPADLRALLAESGSGDEALSCDRFDGCPGRS